MPELSRARSMDEFFDRRSKMQTPEGIAYGRAFEPRPSDVIINTYAKAGTTWMQQIVHGLRTGGDMDFAEITEVVPWIELAGDLGIDLSAEQRGAFRAFKSHAAWDRVGKGCRYICIIRDPKAIALSQFNFLNGWFIEPGSVSPDDFIREFFLKNYRTLGYGAHLLSWWPQRMRPEVLLLCYEDMREDLEGTVETVAAFLGIDDGEAIATATRQASLAFMTAHKSQFDDNLITRKRNAVCGLPPEAISSKVKAGKVGGHEALLSEEINVLIDAAWLELITPLLGFGDYAGLRSALKTPE